MLSSTEDCDEAPCTLLLDWVKERVTFMDLAAARSGAGRMGRTSHDPQRQKRNQDDHSLRSRRGPARVPVSGSGEIFLLNR
jgi:hypothetical protein